MLFILYFDSNYEFYYWFRVKKEAQIIVKKLGYEEGIEFISSKFNKIKNPNVRMVFDVANFYKNSKNYEKAIEYYTEIISSLEDSSEIKSVTKNVTGYAIIPTESSKFIPRKFHVKNF